MNPLQSDTTRWFAEELNPHGPALRAYLCAHFSSLADIENLVQESLMRVLGERERGRVDSAKSLLFAIGRNLALDAVRRQRVVAFEPITDSVPSHTYADGTDVVEFVSKQQELALLRDAIASLPPRCREVLTLRTARGCSQKEIARRMGISENAVEKQMANGLRLCSAYFAQRGMP